MKTTKVVFLLAFCLLSLQSIFSQEETRYDQTLNIECNGVKSKVKLTYISYSLSQYQANADPAAVQKPDPTYLNVTTSETPTKEFMKIFENFKQKVNGFIEIKDNFGKSPSRKFEFKNAYLVLSEVLSGVASGNSSNISIYSDAIVIDGVSIFSK